MGRVIEGRTWKRDESAGQCEICERDDEVLVWDHDHKTGAFRGWLCNRCNLLLGHALDNPAILEAAINYLAAKSAEEAA